MANEIPIRIDGLAEVVLNVRDMRASLAFYRDLLGLEVVSPPERSNPIFLRAGAANADLPALVVLVQISADEAEFTNPRPLNHLALAVPADAFDAAERTLTAQGHVVRTGQHPILPSRTMYVDDPDGNEVEFIAPA